MTERSRGFAFASVAGWIRDVPWRATTNFVKDDCATHAAAIAFYTLLSLAPALYLIGFVLSSVFVDESASQRAIEIIAEFLPPEAVPTVERVQAALDVKGALLLVALPGLLWIATHALQALQSALNVAFARTNRGVTIWTSRLKSFLVFLGGALFLGAIQLVRAALPLLDRFGATLGLPETPPGLRAFVSALATPLLAFLVFHLFYRLLPTGRCSRWPAAAGALVAMLLRELARAAFGAFMLQSPSYGLVTGALAGVLAFLMWIYIGVALILYGAEFAAILNGDRPA